MPRNSSSSPPDRQQPKKVTKAGTTKSADGRQFFPPKTYQKEKAARLTRFPSHRLEDLIGCALKESKTQVTAELIEAIRRRTGARLDQLVEELGVDPQHPDKWQRAFHELATIHQGVGIISWTQPRGPNRRASKWTDEHDLNLQMMVLEETESGLTPTEALRNIAGDPEKWGKLAPQKKNFRSEKSDNERRYQTLRKRWSIVQKTSILEKVLGRALGISVEPELPQPPTVLGKSKLHSAPL